MIAARRAGDAAYDPTRVDWAHGRPGRALLFARAHARFGEPRSLAWAREAIAGIRVLPGSWPAMPDGPIGIAYCLLAVADVDPAGPWRAAAWQISRQSLAYVEVPATNPYGVWSGLGGLCCLALDLLHEAGAGFPGVEA